MTNKEIATRCTEIWEAASQIEAHTTWLTGSELHSQVSHLEKYCDARGMAIGAVTRPLRARIDRAVRNAYGCAITRHRGAT